MSLEKPIVLDANILIRAVLGQRVRHLIVQHADRVQFFAPDAAYGVATWTSDRVVWYFS